MDLRRKSDNYLLCGEISAWTGWKPMYNSEMQHTVEFIPYFHREGAMLKVQQIRCAFSDQFPGAEEFRYWQLVRADRKTQLCKYLDSRGFTKDCYIYEKNTDEDREQDVRSEDIRYVTVILVEANYYA